MAERVWGRLQLNYETEAWTAYTNDPTKLRAGFLGSGQATHRILTDLDIPAPLSITPVGSSPNGNGGAVNGNALTLEPASSQFAGLYTPDLFPQAANFSVTSPVGVAVHNTDLPIVVAASTTTGLTAFTRHSGGTGIDMLLPGLFSFYYNCDTMTVDSQLRIKMQIAGSDYLSAKWNNGAGLITNGPKEACNVTFYYVKEAAGSQTASFLSSSITDANSDVTLGAQNIIVSYWPTNKTK